MQKNDLTDALFKKISRYVYEICGINLSERKRELVSTRIGKVIREKGMAGFKEYFEYLTSDETGEAVSELMNAISTNLTSFFREIKHFDFLKSSLLPEIRANLLNHKENDLRIWSAGCSTGAEAYTLSIVLAESIPELHSINARILATDIDTNVLNTGHQGVYPANFISGIPPHMLQKYFQRSKDGQRYRVKAYLRHLLTYRYLNLIEPFPFKHKFDIIFCRNVMIYFDKPTQQNLINKFHDVLKPGGHLFIGHSESLSSLKHNMAYIKPTIYKKK